MADSISTKAFLDQLRSMRLIVLGDIMLDKYIIGKVSRISPEAPVPILDVQTEENRLGGAANVALNLHAMGIETILSGICGLDLERGQLEALLRRNGLPTYGLLNSTERRTTTKVRVMGNSQHMMRIDNEDKQPLQDKEKRRLLGVLKSAIKEGVDGIILQDYNKGVFTEEMIREVLDLADSHDIPTFVDPKHENFLAFKGCTVFKPNLRELSDATNRHLHGTDRSAIQEAITEVREKMWHKYTFTTLSENGVILCNQHEQFVHIPAHYRKITDVSGAGDTVISAFAAAYCAGLEPETCAELSNLAGGLVCEEVGVAPINIKRLTREITSTKLPLTQRS